MTIKNNLYLSLLLSALGMTWLSTSYALPAFATKTEKKCSYCHNAWPQLNAKGRKYKERGYRLKADIKDTSKKMPFFEAGEFPVSAFLLARPYDKKKNNDRKTRAMYEVEVFVAGAINKEISGYFELEGEDENDFKPEFAPLVLAYRFNDALNVQTVYGQAAWADPYGLLKDNLRLTRGRVGVTDQTFGGVDGKIRDSRQSVNLTGRFAEKWFYSAGYGGEAKNAEGVKAETLFLRGAYDITKNIMIGLVSQTGKAGNIGERDENGDPVKPDRLGFSRSGIDFQGDFGGFRLNAMVLSAKDDVAGGGDVGNNAYSVQGYYAVKKKSGTPTWVPLVRVDSYEKNDGQDEYTDLTLNLTRYIDENVKAYLEIWEQVDAPSGTADASRVTFQIQVSL